MSRRRVFLHSDSESDIDPDEIPNDETKENKEETNTLLAPQLLSTYIEGYTLEENASPNNLLKKIEEIFDDNFPPGTIFDIKKPNRDEPCKFHGFTYNNEKMAIVQQNIEQKETFFIFQFEHTIGTISWNSVGIQYYFDFEDRYKKEYPFILIFNYVLTIAKTAMRFNHPGWTAAVDIARLAGPELFNNIIKDRMINTDIEMTNTYFSNITLPSIIGNSKLVTTPLYIATQFDLMFNENEHPFTALTGVSNAVVDFLKSAEFLPFYGAWNLFWWYKDEKPVTINNIKNDVKEHLAREYLPSHIQNSFELEQALNLLLIEIENASEQTSNVGLVGRTWNYFFGNSGQSQPHIGDDVRAVLLELVKEAIKQGVDINNPLSLPELLREVRTQDMNTSVLESAAQTYNVLNKMQYPSKFKTAGDWILNNHMTSDSPYDNITTLSPIVLKHITEDDLQQILYKIQPPLLQWNAPNPKIPMGVETWEILEELRIWQISKLKVAEFCLLRDPKGESIFEKHGATYSWRTFKKKLKENRTTIKTYLKKGFIDTEILHQDKGILENLLDNWKFIIENPNDKKARDVFKQQLSFVKQYKDIDDEFFTQRFLIILGKPTCRTVKEVLGETQFITLYTALKIKYPFDIMDISVNSNLTTFALTPDQRNAIKIRNDKITDDDITTYEEAVRNVANGSRKFEDVEIINNAVGNEIVNLFFYSNMGSNTPDTRIEELRNITSRIPTGNNREIMNALGEYFKNPTAQNFEKVKKLENSLANDDFTKTVSAFLEWMKEKEPEEMAKNLLRINSFIRFSWGENIFLCYNTAHLLWKLLGKQIFKRTINKYIFNSALSKRKNPNWEAVKGGAELTLNGINILRPFL